MDPDMLQALRAEAARGNCVASTVLEIHEADAPKTARIDILTAKLATAIRERDELRAAKEQQWADGCGLTEAYGKLLDRFYRAHGRVLALKAELDHGKANQRLLPGERT